MKIRKGIKRRSKIKTHEDRAVDDIFAEDEGDFTISLEDVEDETINGFEQVDYNLDSAASKALWENVGEDVAQQITNIFITAAATMDAIRSAEEHAREHFEVTFDTLSRESLNQIETAVNLKIKEFVLDKLELSTEARKMMLIRFAMKGGSNNLEAFKKYIEEITTTGGDENPYGTSLTKQLKREQ